QRRFANFAPLAIAVNVQYFFDRLEFLTADHVTQLFVGERHARAQRGSGLFLKIGGHGAQELFAKPSTGSTTGGGARALLESGQRGDAVGVNGLDDVALADTITTADGVAVGHGRHFEAGVCLARREQNLAAVRRQVGSAAYPVHVSVLIFDVAHEDHAANL